MAYSGMTYQDIDTWQALLDVILGAVQNPYVLGLVAVSVWNAINDPTTAGVKDSSQAMTYDVPKVSDSQ